MDSAEQTDTWPRRRILVNVAGWGSLTVLSMLFVLVINGTFKSSPGGTPRDASADLRVRVGAAACRQDPFELNDKAIARSAPIYSCVDRQGDWACFVADAGVVADATHVVRTVYRRRVPGDRPRCLGPTGTGPDTG